MGVTASWVLPSLRNRTASLKSAHGSTDELEGRGHLYLPMINPVSSAYSNYAAQASQPAVRQPQPPKQDSATVQDKVTLKSTGADADHDGDSR